MSEKLNIPSPTLESELLALFQYFDKILVSDNVFHSRSNVNIDPFAGYPFKENIVLLPNTIKDGV